MNHQKKRRQNPHVEHDYSEITNLIDELLAELLRHDRLPEHEDPLRRYRLIAMLLSELGDYSPGVDKKRLKDEILKAVNPEVKVELKEATSNVCTQIRQILRPSYVAASYWSPIDKLKE